MNATVEKFGWPGTLVADYAHWVVLLRTQAPTLGSLVMAAKSEATAYAALPAPAFAEQAMVVADIEAVLAATIGPEKINYLMLMMVDPHVHFHVIPRYQGSRERRGAHFPDRGWPKLPALAEATILSPVQTEDQLGWLQSCWSDRR